MNLNDMRTRVRASLQEDSTNANYSDTTLDLFLNEGWRFIWSYKNTPWRWLITEATKGVPYTYVGATSTGTNLYPASTTDMYSGQTLYVTNGTIYEKVKISTVGYPTILDGVGLLGSYANSTDNLVIGQSVELPTDFHQLMTVQAEYVDTSSNTQSINTLICEDERRFDVLYPRIESKGEPTHYWLGDDDLYLYPLPDKAYKIRIKYFKKPSVLSVTAEPELPEAYHWLICEYAVARLLEADARNNPVMSPLAQVHWQIFYNGLDELLRSHVARSDSDLYFRAWDDKTLSDFRW